VDSDDASVLTLGNGEDYSRFSMPPVRGMDESSLDKEREYETPRMRELAPFRYVGSSPWPFKYQIKGE
jgi:hypothetical protein